MFSSVLIANRGEIACRVIRTCRRLGIRTIAVYSEADAGARHVRLADEAWPIGGPRPQDSYLRGEAILEVARERGAQAVHPGYGFLSENADFAEAVEAAGIRFIGPSAASMRKMGSKAGAKDLMAAAGVPVVPGYTGEDQAPETLAREAARVGYPLMIKAAHGGGGKGMRIVREAGEFAAALESCRREAANAFGRDRVLLERYIERPRHIEIQVFGDRHGGTIHLGERECSAQRRYQKVLEEAPSPFLTPALRARMGEAAVAAARAIDYANAGTVEFIVAPDGAFYFMEINTRLQVEHPVTELVTGLDLVEWQLRVAAGEPLPLPQEAIAARGHAIEVRLYAEDPDAGFLPGSGRLARLRLPAPDAHVRVDAGVVEGDTVTIFYDPMIAKLIVHDADRPRALARLREALAACEIGGPKSNVAFLERLVRDAAVVEGRIDTGYLDRQPDALRRPADAQADAMLRIAAAVDELLALEDDAARADAGDPGSPWAAGDGWHGAGTGRVRLRLRDAQGAFDAHAEGRRGAWRIALDDAAPVLAEGAHRDGPWLSLRLDGTARRFRIGGDRDVRLVHDGERRLEVARVLHEARGDGADAGAGDRLRAPMPGRIVVVRAAAGDAVAAGQDLLVMEAMKMEIAIKAPRDGTLAAVAVAVGEFVEAETVLAELEPAP
ncbi:acetyl/propionyl/methylcrotonyl-CoA carboxylase subunit alpha [Luteimonas huabeiensis]|uniref:acetyl/propionyl/methylcrotonyl-CoA carboxylase subunit alpha n=1 Tax=Luteimonas huabeiensis TaxID=1244513 RepID=UPI000463FF3B|nr:biotin carboxylase N-terminal domain-containing protein [Luteimonas huabeiensis]